MNHYPLQPLSKILTLDIDDYAVSTQEIYPIAGVYGFGRGLFHRSPIKGSETSYNRLNRLQEGRLVLSRLKAFEGAIAVVSSQFDGSFLSPEFPTFRIDDSLADPIFLKYLCQWPEIWTALRGISKGVGARKERVSAEQFLSITVPLPELEEQRRIGKRLHSLIHRISGIESIQRDIEIIWKKIPLSLFSEIKDSAKEVVRLGEVLRLERYPVEVDPTSHYHYIGMRSFGRGIMHYPATLGSELSKLNYFSFPENALVLSNIKAWEGAIGITSTQDRDYIASSRFLFYIPVDGRVNVSYLRHYLLTKPGLAQIAAASPGAADRNRTLGVKRFEKIEVSLPDIDTQARVAEMLDSLQRGVALARQDSTQGSFRPAIFKAAFNGEL